MQEMKSLKNLQVYISFSIYKDIYTGSIKL